MENSSKRTLGMKTLAVTGFIVIIIFFVWLAVQIVSLIPGAFSSLASLADSIYNERPQSEIIVSSESSIVNSGNTFTINWTDTKQDGVYTFSYACSDGVALDVRHPGNTITPVACGETISLGNMIYSLEIFAKSEKSRFADVTYTIGFMKDGKDEVAFSKSSTFTVVNANIPQSQSGEVVTPEPEVETPVEPTTPVVTPTPAPTPVKPGKPVVIETPIFTTPVSDPKGNVDLAVRFIAVGTLNSKNVFVKGGTIDEDARGAFQFEVKNLGTKTSADWNFEAKLTSGNVYKSKDQAPLKPQERSTITLGFDEVGSTGTKSFGASVTVKGDTNTKNNAFSSSVKVTN